MGGKGISGLKVNFTLINGLREVLQKNRAKCIGNLSFVLLHAKSCCNIIRV